MPSSSACSAAAPSWSPEPAPCSSRWWPRSPCSPPPSDDLRFASRRGGGTTLAALAGHGGGTEAFAVGASFVGFLVFVTFIALIAGEFSGGTFRALLLREPHRLRVIVGKLAGILIVAAGVVALAEVVTFVLSLLVAPTRTSPRPTGSRSTAPATPDATSPRCSPAWPAGPCSARPSP